METLTKRKIQKIVLSLLLLALGLIIAVPLFWMISSSFKPENKLFLYPIKWIPKEPIYTNYIKAWTEFPLGKWYWNTIKVTMGIVIFSLSSSALAGYAFAKLHFKGKYVLLIAYISTMMIPFELRIIPQFTLYQFLHLSNTHWTIILPWVFNPFNVFMLRQAFMSIPGEITESAKIDGCPELKIFWKLMIPNITASLVALFIIQFVHGWNSYLAPIIYLASSDQQMLSPGIATFAQEFSSNYALQMAGASSALIPMLIVYIIGQKNFIEGIAMTGIKG